MYPKKKPLARKMKKERCSIDDGAQRIPVRETADKTGKAQRKHRGKTGQPIVENQIPSRENDSSPRQVRMCYVIKSLAQLLSSWVLMNFLPARFGSVGVLVFLVL